MGKAHNRLDKRALRALRRAMQRPGRVPCGCVHCYPQTDREHRMAILALREGLDDAAELEDL